VFKCSYATCENIGFCDYSVQSNKELQNSTKYPLCYIYLRHFHADRKIAPTHFTFRLQEDITTQDAIRTLTRHYHRDCRLLLNQKTDDPKAPVRFNIHMTLFARNLTKIRLTTCFFFSFTFEKIRITITWCKLKSLD